MNVFDAMLKLLTNVACQANVYKGLVNLSTHDKLLRVMVDRHVIAQCIDSIADTM